MLDLDTAIPAKASGFRFYGDTCGVLWAVFDRDAVEKFSDDVVWDSTGELAAHLLQRSAAHRGTGRGFSEWPELRFTRTRVLVYQRCGIDV